MILGIKIIYIFLNYFQVKNILKRYFTSQYKIHFAL
jgi:hypothetical protein